MRRRGSYGHVINMVGLSGHRIPDGPQGGGFYAGALHAACFWGAGAAAALPPATASRR
jgi:hypothetical protein